MLDSDKISSLVQLRLEDSIIAFGAIEETRASVKPKFGLITQAETKCFSELTLEKPMTKGATC